MKKIIYSAAAMALAFFAVSCQQENLEPEVSANTVTYTVEVPGALATKAIGDEATAVDKVYYQVYREAEVDDPAKTFVYDGEAEVNAGKASFDLEFVKNQKFVVLFWAQDEDLQMFNIEDLRKVQLTTPGASNNVNAQVFAGSDTVTDCVSGKGGIVELTRPISQLNIFTTKESLKYGDKTIDLVSSTVTVKGIYTTYNVAAGDVVTTADPATANFTYSKTTVPDTQDADPYVYVAMNYVGFAPALSTTVDVEFTITTSEGDVPHSVSSVPVKPNYRTNIVGNLLTEATDYNVTLKAGWADEEYNEVVVSTAIDLQTTVNEAPDGEATEITLSGDIDFGDLLGTLTKAASDPASLVIPATKTVVLNLNGCTLSQTAKQTGAHSMIVNNGNLTIVDNKGNGKISYSDTGNGGEYVSNTIVNNGRLVIESGVIENNSSATVASNGYPHPVDNNGGLIINGGTLTNNANYASMRIWCTTDDNTSVTINGGTFNGSIDFQTPSAAANKGSLTINGGTFNADTYTKCAVRLLGFGADVDEMLGYIKGGTFNGKVARNNWSGAEFNSQVFYITGGKFSNDPSEFVVEGYPVFAPETEGGYYTIGQFVPVAKIGDQEYGSLRAAVNAVEENGTITLVNNVEFTEKSRECSGGTWYEGLYYLGDKSFTIDLNGKTISQNGAVNDYMFLFKNDGSKDNVITFKNGTIDAGTTAYCALCTSTTSTKKITLNVESLNITGNNSNGGVCKIRGGAEFNVKARTVITGKNSYVGIEAVGNNTVVNVYEGAEIYQNGTSSYVGAIIGASYNATLNIYGGKGKSAKCGIIVMSTGATINVSGGEWTANGDGTVSNDNAGVLVSQNNRYESGWACKSILNVTGGTFKGGYNCYGMGPGVEADDAQINIKGGNFNANPETYVVAGYEVTENSGTYTVAKPAALQALETALAKGGNVTLTNDVTLLESIKIENNVVLDLNGKTITAPLFSAFEVKAGGDLTVKNGKVVAYESTVRAIGGKVTIESGEYTSTGTALDSPATYRYSLDCREGGELIINGGTFKSNNGMINVGSTVTINGGKFENVVEKTMTRHFAYVSAPLTINDGEFYGKANSSAGGCFFCGAAAGGKIQVNGGKFTSLWTSGSVNRIFEVYFGGTINVTGGMFNTNGGIATFVTENTDEATKAAYPYVAK